MSSAMGAARGRDPIAIVGIGCRFAGARDLHEFWQLCLSGDNVFGPVPADRWDHEAFFDANPRSRDKSYSPTGAFIEDVRSFPAVALQVPPRRVEVMDPQQRLSLECALQAIEDSGRGPGDLPRRTGVYMGLTAMEYRTLAAARVIAQMMASGSLGTAPEDSAVIADAVERVLPARPFSAPGALSNMSAATIAQELRLYGPAFTTDAACASGLVALSSAVEALRAGTIDCALAGGVYLCVTPEHHIAFSRIGAISKSGVCRPFDDRADGFVQGDGCGVLMLKRQSDAERDGDRIYALIHGLSMNNDGGSTGPMAPVKSGQVEVVRQAWADAGLSPATLGYVETHGTGTKVGDRIEFEGLSESVGPETRRAALGSSKANFGHTMSAAGVAGLIRAVMAVHDRSIPPMANFETPKDEVKLEGSPFFIPTERESWDAAQRLAAVSSFGFGGTNVHVVVGNAEPPAERPVEQAELLLLSSFDEASLRDLCARTARALQQDDSATVAGVCRSWATRRQQASRVAVVATGKAQLIARLTAIGRGDYPERAVFGTAAEDPPKVAFMYPGQGAQRIGMIAGIRDRFDVVAETLDELDAATVGVMPTPITELLYPERRALAIDDAAAMAELTETENCQPALFAVGAALTRLLRQVGVTPAVVCGHSVGEFTAAMAGGVTSAAEGVRWVARRGQGMAAMTGDRGAMVAIVADRATVEGLLVDGTNIANINHPRQMVVSGTSAAIEQVAVAAEARELKTVRLTVSHGFHSPVFEALDLDATIDAIEMSDPRVPVASGIIDHPYADAAEARRVYKAHATSPVVFTGALAQCEALGADIFLQVGAGGPLLSFARGTLEKGHQGILSLASKDDADGGASLLEALGQLWVRGVDVDVAAITAEAQLASVPPLVLPRESYWVVKDEPQIKLKLAGPSENAQRAGAPAGEAQPVAAAATPSGSTVADLVMAAVARASAYPQAALRPSMRLGDDLGFDSMMVADLAEDLAKSVPGVNGIPQEILINQPTIADIIAFAENPGLYASVDEDDDAPLDRYEPYWTATPLPTHGARSLPGGRVLLAGDGVDGWAAAFAAAGYRRVAEGSAELLVFGAPSGAPVPVTAVLSGEARAPDHATALMELLDAQGRAGSRPDVLIVRRPDDPWAEALSGVARCVAREWPDRVVKVVSTLQPAAEQLLDELTSADRSVDLRYDGGERQVMGTQKVPDGALSWTPSADDVVLVTGGTRGIGRDLGLALAEAGAGRVVMVGRALPDEPSGHERAVFAVADVTDRASLRAVCASFGPVSVLVHAAGVLADGAIGTVDPEKGKLARSIKTDGWLNAIEACGPSLKLALGIGSWAGRFGNAHQAHYGAGNALLSELSQHLPQRIRAVVSEFGPWSDSEMVKSIPQAIQQAMRSEGIDFVGPTAGRGALIDDLGSGVGPLIRGRRVPGTTRRAAFSQTLAVASHPFLADHAIEGTPVLPLASASTMLVEAAGLRAPFEVSDLTLYKGVTVAQPVTVALQVAGDRAELAQISGDTRALSYKATVRPWEGSAPSVPPMPQAGAAPTLPLAEFYGDVTFHGPLLQGIQSLDGIGEDFVTGTIQTGRPSDWIPGTTQTSWAIDPLAFDSAMQLTAYVAWTRFGRAGTPVGFARFVQLKEWPQGEVITASAHFGASVADKFSADIVFRTRGGELIAVAEQVTAQLVEVVDKASTAEDSQPAEAEATPFEVKPEWVDPSQWKGYKDLALRLHAVDAMGLKNPYFDVHQGTARNTTLIDGQEIINYSSYNYIGLSGDERVLDRVEVAMRKYGTSVSASRVASGERPFHHQLEAALAEAQGVDDALVMPGGHATNVNTIGHLFGPADLIMHDELIHDSCLQGIKLSGAARRGYRHEDLAHLEEQLKELRPHYEKVLILVEGVYSMDGDITDLPGLIALKKKYGCMLMVDEAHSFGTIGQRGHGVGEHFDVDRRDVDIWMGTMSKSLASMGGWIAGSKELITYARYTTPGFVFAAGIPPTLGVAALASLQLMDQEPWRVERLQHNCRFFYDALVSHGLDTGPARGESPVIPVITGDSMHALKLSERLLDEHRINAKPIIFPAVANDAARLRFFLTTLHTEEELSYTALKVAEALSAIRSG